MNPQRRRWVATLAAAGALGVTGATARATPAARAQDDGGRRILRVGPERALKTLAAAARSARDGDIVEVDPGDYRADVAVWPQTDLVIRGVGTRPRLLAEGAHAQGKAIFVVRGDRVMIENLAFAGCKVPDGNGAGIRHERGRLDLHRCWFNDNENGVLTANEPGAQLHAVDCGFVDNGAGDGRTHNLYVGAIAAFSAMGCYFGRAKVGHLVKSRALDNALRYCRLTDEAAPSSYELEFPNGGRALVVGCLIQQGPRSENSGIVSFGAEGAAERDNQLTLAFNTIVNDRPQGGQFVVVRDGAPAVRLLHTLLVGGGSLELGKGTQEQRGVTSAGAQDFADAARFDYRLRMGATQVGAAGALGRLPPDVPRPTHQYQHPSATAALSGFTPLTPLSPGAFQRLAT